MTIDEKYMSRCLQLAAKGVGCVAPNPMVGAVIVENGEIIGEGFHRKYGEAHAEVNAINSVKDRERLKSATIYVSLEPCAHYGNTPPCAELIVRSGIPNVVMAMTDPNPSVAGRGIKILKSAGVNVVTDVLRDEAVELNRVFVTNQVYKRPFVVLKWAQSADGFMDEARAVGDGKGAVVFSNDVTSVFVHKLRTEIQGIMVGTNTALLDNPKLSARSWFGKNPVRVVLDRSGRLNDKLSLFDGSVRTIVITELEKYHISGANVEPHTIDFTQDVPKQILGVLYNNNVYSVMIEGGASLLNSFIDANCWDEAFVEVSSKKIGSGLMAPSIDRFESVSKCIKSSVRHHLKNKTTQNII